MRPLRTAIPVTVVLGALLAGAPAVAAPIVYTATLTGAAEDPPNASPGTGMATVVFDDVAFTLTVSAVFAGLVAPTTAAHIHAPTAVPFAGSAGVATMTPSFLNFPLGVTTGTMPVTVFDLLDQSTYNDPFFINQGAGNAGQAAAALGAALAQGRAYFNIHTNGALGGFPGGEIRGFLVPAQAPEPATMVLLALGLLGVRLTRRD